MAPSVLSREEMLRLFDLLEEELAASNTSAELYLVGGAVMCLALRARESTRDIDAMFTPTADVRRAAARVAARAGLPDTWLNDAVKGWLGANGEFQRYIEKPHLAVFTAKPEYLLAMKCMAMRIGEEFHDLDDVRYLLRYLNITRLDGALTIVGQYFDPDAVPLKTRLALEEILQ